KRTLLCSHKRKPNEKPPPPPLTVRRNNHPAIRLDQLSRNRKTEADTTRSRARTTIKLLEYSCFFSRLETNAPIGNRNDQHGIIAGGVHFNRLIAFAITHRVREQCIERLLNQA